LHCAPAPVTGAFTVGTPLHPSCPCSRATVGELERLMSHTTPHLAARVIFLAPAGSETDPTRTDLRATDAPCRFGGEEFALILSETDQVGALLMAEQVRAQIASLSFQPKGAPVTVSASLGVASSDMFPPAELSASRLLAAADDALYRAKSDGRNRVVAAEG
jgi:hypothetical protein